MSRHSHHTKTYRAKRRRSGSLKIMHMIGWNVSILQTVLSAAGWILLKMTDLLPDLYVLVIAVVLVLLVLIPRLLMKWRIRKVRWAIGLILSVLICGVLIYASWTLYHLADTLQNITGATQQETQVAVYVRTDDEAVTVYDTADYVYGIMDTVAREDSESTIEMIEEEITTELEIVEYAGLLELAQGLLNEDVDAIVLSEDYVEIIAELDGYEDFEDQVRQLTTYSWIEEIAAAEDEIIEDGTFIMYMSGIDTTGSVSTKSRSDVNILAVVNTQTRQVLLLSTPRDYYVELSLVSGAMDKLTHAGIYGVDVSMETLELLYDTDIEYYFRINFTGFEDLIDALGGITVYSEYAFTAVKGGYTYSVGYNDLTGAEALSFARERKAFTDGDVQRGKNQMAVIEAVIDKMLTPTMLANFSDILETVEDCFETNMSYSTIGTLVREQLADDSEWNIQTYSVTGSDSSQYTYSGGTCYVMIPDDTTVETAKTLINQVLSGETLDVDGTDSDADDTSDTSDTSDGAFNYVE